LLPLAKLMLIKDEFYVAHLLTSYEKLRRDKQRYNINPANGDRIKYRRVFHPRFFGRKVSISLPHWSLYILRELRWLRKFLPLYHRSDRQFLAMYESLIEQFNWQTDEEYARWLEILRAPDVVRGYREYREPTMEQAKRRIEDTLAELTRLRQRQQHVQVT